jgi:hypothetical protein
VRWPAPLVLVAADELCDEVFSVRRTAAISPNDDLVTSLEAGMQFLDDLREDPGNLVAACGSTRS